MDESIKTAISEILSYLSDGGRYKEYDFHLKYGLSPFLIDKAVEYLLSVDVLVCDSEGYFKINSKVEGSSLAIIRNVLSKRDFKINDNYGRLAQEPLEINEPYLPNEKLLDPEFMSV